MEKIINPIYEKYKKDDNLDKLMISFLAHKYSIIIGQTLKFIEDGEWKPFVSCSIEEINKTVDKNRRNHEFLKQLIETMPSDINFQTVPDHFWECIDIGDIIKYFNGIVCSTYGNRIEDIRTNDHYHKLTKRNEISFTPEYPKDIQRLFPTYEIDTMFDMFGVEYQFVDIVINNRILNNILLDKMKTYLSKSQTSSTIDGGINFKVLSDGEEQIYLENYTKGIAEKYFKGATIDDISRANQTKKIFADTAGNLYKVIEKLSLSEEDKTKKKLMLADIESGNVAFNDICLKQYSTIAG